MLTKKRKKRRESEIPVGSFSDIAFLLIIFFILTTAFVNNLGFDTEIPSGEKSEEKKEKMTTVKLHHNEIRLNDSEKKLTIPQLRRRLDKMKLGEKKKDQDKIVVLEPSGKVPYQRYYEVMHTIKEAGGVIAILRENK